MVEIKVEILHTMILILATVVVVEVAQQKLVEMVVMSLEETVAEDMLVIFQEPTPIMDLADKAEVIMVDMGLMAGI